jgi:membrane protein implicated in regulation of membrane protease activity
MKLLFDFGINIEFRWIWLGLAIVLAVIEGLTLGLTTIWFAIAALVMVFVSFLPIPLLFQLLIFAAISAALLFFTRPIAIKKFKVGRVKTNVDSLVGKHALVIKQIAEFERGEVKLNGQIWSAKTEDGAAITEGTKCEVVRIEGVQAIVKKIDQDSTDGTIDEQNK